MQTVAYGNESSIADLVESLHIQTTHCFALLEKSMLEIYSNNKTFW